MANWARTAEEAEAEAGTDAEVGAQAEVGAEADTGEEAGGVHLLRAEAGKETEAEAGGP